jgi:DNA anti-recombination protein RmuC
MSETCVCGGSTAKPNPDCERCQLIATLTARESELAEAQRRISSIAKSQLNACTTECIDGIWWAKGSGIVAGPQATERDALLEVAENWWRVAEKRESELAEAKRRVAELEAEVQRVTRNCQHNLDGKREQERLKKLYLKQLREACGIIHIPGKESDDGEMH